MTSDRDVPKPVWQPGRIHIGRRRALMGISAVAMSALHARSAWAQASLRCVLTPEAGEGPFYLDPNLVRADLTSGLPGAPLELGLQVVRVGDCATLSNARVDVWHADALGLYSGVARQGGVGGVAVEAAVGKQYLRGTQFTNADGKVQFKTIYPSWYGGRTPHVHFKVFLGGKEVVASQVFFPDDINNEVFSQFEPYRAHTSKRRAFNHNDPIREGVYSDVVRAGRQYRAQAVLVVAPG